MTDPLPPRGAFARLALVAALSFAVIAAAGLARRARADDAGAAKPAASASALGASDLAAAQSLVTAWGGGALTRIDEDLVAGLRAIDVGSPEADVAGPVAISDRAFVAPLPDKEAAHVFGLGDKVCGGIEILPRGALPALDTVAPIGGAL